MGLSIGLVYDVWVCVRLSVVLLERRVCMGCGFECRSSVRCLGLCETDRGFVERRISVGCVGFSVCLFVCLLGWLRGLQLLLSH